ncbi:hypothetical protein GCM10011594_13000 [Nakamurella endophytica]|uniref:Uncharacterized protein n=2 Tax=Nakamurella endophytica TaxID=1748367 RepID=A0A917SSX2_9ACTN|nr:hypothetical protein GCM10011594_13000 [Nakamurella endophytica]
MCAAALAVAGCATLGSPGQSEGPSPDAVVAAWEGTLQHVPLPALIVTSSMPAQIGTWSVAEGGHNKLSLLSGRVVSGPDVARTPPPAAMTVTLPRTGGRRVGVITAEQAVAAIAASGSPDSSCDGDCTPVTLESPRLVLAPMKTTAGPVRLPAWTFQVRGSKVRISQVALAPAATVIPPELAGGRPAVAGSDWSARLIGRTAVAVTFVGGPEGDGPCGHRYTATVTESDRVVAVSVDEADHAEGSGVACSAIGARRTVTAELAGPLGRRLLVDGRTGQVVTVTN